ncbi:acyl-CoA dehydrogenase family protein [Streptomyces phaeochromogenes]|uniref:acyl-CoA dehydrogenase family protein n=1 Tax=Streptomyces phaeochromogenes TaxID=1923 RepID=UPI0036C1D389
MTEPQGGVDVSGFGTTAVRDGDEWVVNGWKFFSSNARYAGFCIVMAYTDKAAWPHKGMSMFLVPTDTPGLTIERDLALIHEPADEGSEAYIHYDDVRVPATALLGEEGRAFEVAQVRLGGGRVHHAMRTVGLAQRALDMMCERALSRTARGTALAERETVQSYIAESYAQLTQFRLFVLRTAWLIDETQDHARCRKDISAVKFLTPKVLHDIVQRAIQVHGALGVTQDTPLARMWVTAPVMGLVDGPTEVHLRQVARQPLKEYEPSDSGWPTTSRRALKRPARSSASPEPEPGPVPRSKRVQSPPVRDPTVNPSKKTAGTSDTAAGEPLPPLRLTPDHWAGLTPDRPAVIVPGGPVPTYGQLARSWHSLGLAGGDRVAIVMENRVEYLIAAGTSTRTRSG